MKRIWHRNLCTPRKYRCTLKLHYTFECVLMDDTGRNSWAGLFRRVTHEKTQHVASLQRLFKPKAIRWKNSVFPLRNISSLTMTRLLFRSHVNSYFAICYHLNVSFVVCTGYYCLPKTFWPMKLRYESQCFFSNYPKASCFILKQKTSGKFKNISVFLIYN